MPIYNFDDSSTTYFREWINHPKSKKIYINFAKYIA